MADHMRRNDKLQALASNANAQSGARRSASREPGDPANARPVERRATPTNASGGRGGNGRASGNRQVGGMSLGAFVKRNATYIISVAAVAALAVLMIFFLKACAPDEAKDGQTGLAPAYTSPYDWSKLDRTGGRYAYVVDGQVKSRLGIDVSENQYDIDWQAVAADGIDFAIIRLGYRGATEGNLYLDAYCRANLDGARSAGLDCGIYFFSQAITEEEAVEEAEFVLDNLGGTPLEYPIAFDSEVIASLGITRTANLSDDQMTAIVEAFCARIEQDGYQTVVYGNAGDLSRYRAGVFEGRNVWWAEYGAAQPSHYLDIAMWQYSNAGEVAGVGTNVDMNIDLSGVLE